ncbi:sensor histidine kinase [Ktedonosporobacter rubrisoli]|uniref:histidine kinase n=1 Tax=Ktedonosporobacter rubrisoli TaxID=2509675 RepID=A0A4P6JK16_KTERU|nr:sensor histidine kinase [Ktedonosporobacter rubrisoli]QBD75479.1 sensor histidine kinase [Ktedonosporobacter rubrisoli]
MNSAIPLPWHFHRLRWKLTISYLLTSLIVLLVLELLVILIGTTATEAQRKTLLSGQAQRLVQAASLTAPAAGATRQQQFQALWDLLKDNAIDIQGYLAVISPDGQVIRMAGNAAPSTNAGLPGSVQQDIRQARSAQPAPSSQARVSFVADSAYAVAPFGESGIQHEVLLARVQSARSNGFPDLLVFFGASALIFFLGAGSVGLAFGFVTARGLVRRLQHIAVAVEGWSRGNFSIFVSDDSRDELGQLAHRLNLMAHQLQELLSTRQDLATLEERNRLARELHDSVKQQVFAVSLHISTTRAFMGRNEQAAQTHLLKAEGLIRQAQSELTTLIRELRPVALEGRSLAEALRDFTHSWQEQTGIAVELRLEGAQEVPLAIENAFFRIAQEGLANVARHSQATAATVHLSCKEMISLTISDNGRGFVLSERARQGFGLSSMRERAQALGAHFEVESTKNAGTTITVQCQQTQREA